MPDDSPIKPVERGGTVTLLDTAKANELIKTVNRLMAQEVVFTTNGPSQVVYAENGRIYMQVNTRDINLGVVDGSRSSGAATASLLAALGRIFTLSDRTTS